MNTFTFKFDSNNMLSFLKKFPLELTFLKVEREVVVSETMSRSLCEIVANSKFTLTDEKESSAGKRPIDPKKINRDCN